MPYQTTKDDMQKQFPSEFYEEHTLSFSNQEKSLLQTYHTIKAMGELADALINNLVQNGALPRTGMQMREGIGTFYDIPNGTFSVFVPKQWCSACNKKAATATIEEKPFCSPCFALKRLQMAKKNESQVVG